MAYTSIEGYDNESNCQSSKEEKWERSTRAAKWIVFSLIIAGILIYAVKLNVEDVLLKMNGNSIVTEFKNGTIFKGVNEDGNAVAVEYKDKTTINIVRTNNYDDNKPYHSTETRQYGKNRITAFTDNNGIIRIVPIMFTMIDPFNAEKVNVYYYGDNEASAKALNSLWFWVVLYGLLILMFFICARIAYRITYPTSHVILEAEAENKALKNKISKSWERK